MTTATYWYHPESDCYYFLTEPITEADTDYGLACEIDEDRYVQKIIEKIDADPSHALPEGVDAVIKLASGLPEKCISGMIWYDRHKRFPNGHPITTTKIVAKEPGGIYKTKNSAYLVEVVMPTRPQVEVEGTNG